MRSTLDPVGAGGNPASLVRCDTHSTLNLICIGRRADLARCWSGRYTNKTRDMSGTLWGVMANR